MNVYYFWWRWDENAYYVDDTRTYCYRVTVVAKNLVQAKEIFYKTMSQESSYVDPCGKLTYREVSLDSVPFVVSKSVERD